VKQNGARTGVYEAAERWVSAALRSDDSLFSFGMPIWSPAVIADLYTRFVENPDESSRSFIVKLEGQLSNAPDETIQLAGELLYFHYLVADDISGDHKRARINQILQWAENPVDIPDDLGRPLDVGIAATGVAFKTHQPFQLAFLLDAVRHWKGLEPSERDRLLGDAWAFKEFVHSLPMKSAFAQREALVHFVHPDSFESITSREIKRQIADSFADYVRNDSEDIDRQLADIRAGLTAELGRDFGFWDDDVRPRWMPVRVSAPTEREAATDGRTAPHPLRPLADELLIPLEFLEEVEELLRDKRQIIFSGPPGTGKTYVARKLAEHLACSAEAVELVQFHPSYAYEDFIEGFRPREEGGEGFELRDGPLKKMARAAQENPEALHLLVIDEINRANIAKVFGELYFLLEYRHAKIHLQYSREPFELPWNLVFIGTMNTADRSIALVDTALRRRFYFVPFFPDEFPIEGLLDRWLQRHRPDLAWVGDVVRRANDLLQDRHLAIGPSHFMRPELTERWVELVWKHSVLPTLSEHFFGEEHQLAQFDLQKLRKGDAIGGGVVPIDDASSAEVAGTPAE
jgi:5-methylcytosine-specific restriction enzyme B